MRTVALSEIAEQVRGVSYGKADVVDRPSDGYLPVLRANNITEGGLDLGDLVFVRSDKVGARQKIRSGDIVIAASSGSISVVGKSAQAQTDLEAGFGAFCKVVRPSNRVDHRYLGHFFRTPAYRQKMSALAAGANINNLKNEHIDELEIPLPPLEEQKRIAAILDQADELHRKRQRALDRLNQLGQAIFIEMFGDLEQNSKAFPVASLSELISLQGGYAFKSANYEPEGIPVVRIGEVNSGFSKKFVFYPPDKKLDRFLLRPDEIVLSLTGTVGKDDYCNIAIVPRHFEKYYLNQRVARVVVNPKVANDAFVTRLFSLPHVKHQAIKNNRGIRQANLSNADVYQIRVPIPPLELQQEFSVHYRQIETLISQSAAALDVQELLFASLQHRAFRGDLTASHLKEVAA